MEKGRTQVIQVYKNRQLKQTQDALILLKKKDEKTKDADKGLKETLDAIDIFKE